MDSAAHYEKPLSLLFSESEVVDFDAILAGHNGIALRRKSPGKLDPKKTEPRDVQSGLAPKKYASDKTPAGSWNIKFEGIEFNITCHEDGENVENYKQIFCNLDFSSLYFAATISLGSHVKDGRKNPAIIASLFRLTRELIAASKPAAVIWNISKIISDPKYFAETVGHYEDGGAFPILSTIDFGYDDDMVQTFGMSYFSNQEIRYAVGNLQQADAMKRVMRIAHDIAVNGAYHANIEVAGLEANEKIFITPDGDGIAQARSIF